MLENHKWPFPKNPKTLWWRICSPITITFVGTISKLWMNIFTKSNIYNKENLINVLESKKYQNRSLITVANHHSCIDDPLLFGVLNWKYLFSPSQMRWSLGAHDICFTKDLHATFFGLGRVIPIVRGDGIFQRGMNFALEKLNDGGWVHVFPESKINLDKSYIRFKWGVGRLVDDCDHIPLVVPIYHLGMDSILPNKKPYIPQPAQNLSILIGDPIDFKDLVEQMRSEGKDSAEIRKVVTEKIQLKMEELKATISDLHNA